MGGYSHALVGEAGKHPAKQLTSLLLYKLTIHVRLKYCFIFSAAK